MTPEQMELARLRAELADRAGPAAAETHRPRAQREVVERHHLHRNRRSEEFQKALAGYGMRSSLSRKDDCWDNAPTESLWGRVTVDRMHGRKFATRRQAMDEVIEWLAFHNYRRLHFTLGHRSPRQYEELWAAAQLNKVA